MPIVLGIDGGGTRTRASIVTGEQLLAHAESGSIKRLRVGAEAAEANLRALLNEVYAQAGVSGVRAASVGVATPPCPASTEWIIAVFAGICASSVPRSSATKSSPSTRPSTAGLESCKSPAPAPTPSAARPTAAANAPAAGVRAWATRAPATGSASTASPRAQRP